MATFRAIEAVSKAVVELLRRSYPPSDFDNLAVDFDVYASANFASPMEAGASFFLYRVYANGTQRTPAGRFASAGQRYRSRLPIDMCFLLTVWGKDASMQHALLGWIMRVLEDTPILPPALLNAVVPGSFRPDETVELALAELSNEDLTRFWETLTPNGRGVGYRPSVPYIARNIHIDSTQLEPGGAPLQERTFEIVTLGAENGPA